MQRYPLSWPDGWKRTQVAYRKGGRFFRGETQHTDTGSRTRQRDITIADATARVLGELEKFGVPDGDAIISTNLVTRLDGLPRSGQPEPADPGAAVYWQRPGDKSTKVMAIDIYDRCVDNLAAIAATLNAMRAIERHGGAQILERAFTGFDALPNPARRAWRDVLGSDITSRAQLETVYKRLRSESHPDKGGNAERFNDVQRAYDDALKELSA